MNPEEVLFSEDLDIYLEEYLTDEDILKEAGIELGDCNEEG